MTTYSLEYTQGIKLSALQYSCPIGERLTIDVACLGSSGDPRDCTGGTLRFSWVRRASGSSFPTGAPLSVAVSGDATGLFSAEISEVTTRYFDGSYSCDIWYEPATGSPEQVQLVSTITFGPVIGTAGDQTLDAAVEAQIDGVKGTTAKVYTTVALARVNADPDITPYILVLGRGLFAWTTSSGTDTDDELTDYIAGTGGGFAIDQASKQGGATGERPPSPRLGQTYYDTTLTALVVYNGSTWVTV